MAEVTMLPQATGRRMGWQWMLALGVVLLLLGLAGAGATTLLALTSSLVFGPLLLASSVIQLLIGFIAGPRPRGFMQYAAAGVEALLGFLIMAHPVVVLTDLVVAIAAFLMVIGCIRLVCSFVTHSPGRDWALLAGGAALILGACVWLQLPVSGLWFVGLCIAVDFLCHGTSWYAVALADGNPVEMP